MVMVVMLWVLQQSKDRLDETNNAAVVVIVVLIVV